MTIYFDVSCLNRPFDDQRQTRIRLEAEAVTLIFDRIDAGVWGQVASEVSLLEIAATPDEFRRRRMIELLPSGPALIGLSEQILDRAAEFESIGFSPGDAAHLSAAETAGADVFLTCDDRLLRRAVRHGAMIGVAVANPLRWLEGQDDAADPR